METEAFLVHRWFFCHAIQHTRRPIWSVFTYVHSSSYSIRFINSETRVRANTFEQIVLWLRIHVVCWDWRSHKDGSRWRRMSENGRNQISDSFLPVKDLYQLFIRLCQAWIIESVWKVNWMESGVIWIHSSLFFFFPSFYFAENPWRGQLWLYYHNCA